MLGNLVPSIGRGYFPTENAKSALTEQCALRRCPLTIDVNFRDVGSRGMILTMG